MEEKEKIIEIEIERLRDFRDHPFKVKDDLQMQQLMKSVEHYGILNPLIVRPVSEGVYEIISGHRRKYAALQLGYRKVPVIIRVLGEEEAVVSMVDANLQREVINPSEKAFAYKMKYDAIKRKAGRRKKGQDDYQLKGTKTVEIIGKELGDSPKQVQRYLKITDLVPEFLQMLDDGKISFNPAYEISYLKEEEQRQLIEVMGYTQSMPSVSQAQRIKKLSQEGNLSKECLTEIMGECKNGGMKKISFQPEQLYRFFPKSYSLEKMKREILEILKVYANE